MPEIAQEKETGRIEAFSDGIFAIAITLLILDLHVPTPPAGGAPFSLASALFRLWPAVVAYLMSFAIILVMWVNHHRIFTIVRRVDQPFLFWNGLLLLVVTVVPFPTALLAAYMGQGRPADFRTAAVVYAGHGFIIALVFNALWRYAVGGARLLTPGHMDDEVRRLSAQYRWGPLSYLVAFLLAFVLPWGSVGLCILMAAFFSFQGFMGRA